MLCTIPFGFPVEPDVYNMKRGSSESIISAGQSPSTFSISSPHHTSLPSFVSISEFVLFKTIHFSMEGVFFIALSEISFNGIILSPLYPPSEVIKILQFASFILSDNDFEENPAKTTE